MGASFDRSRERFTFDEDNNTLSITQLPEFTLNPNYCIDFYFKNSENRTFWAGNYDSQYSTRTSWTLNNAIPGELENMKFDVIIGNR